MQHLRVVTDKELVRLYQSGKDYALTELLRRYKDKIYSSVYYLVYNRELAEDLFQDSCIRILTGLKQKHYDEQGKFLPWAIRIAHNVVIDHFRIARHMRMVRETEEYSPFDIIPEHARNAAEEMIHNEKVMQVRNLVERLPSHQKEVLILRHYAGLSFKEIADSLDININTALGRMHYALKELRLMMTGSTEIEAEKMVAEELKNEKKAKAKVQKRNKK
jgi:RNA polymerase sigma-70 factor (ECF subfamily)